MVQISSVMQNQILKLALMGVYKKFWAIESTFQLPARFHSKSPICF
jgi:hypothetical protein